MRRCLLGVVCLVSVLAIIFESCVLRRTAGIVVPPTSIGVFEINLQKVPQKYLKTAQESFVGELLKKELGDLAAMGVRADDVRRIDGFILPTDTYRDAHIAARLSVRSYDVAAFSAFTRGNRQSQPEGYKTLTYYMNKTKKLAVFSPSDIEIDLADSTGAMDAFLEGNIISHMDGTSRNEELEKLLVDHSGNILYFGINLPASWTHNTPGLNEINFLSGSANVSTKLSVQVQMRTHDPSVAEGLAYTIDGTNKMIYGALRLWPSLERSTPAAAILPPNVAVALTSASGLLRSLKTSFSGDTMTMDFTMKLTDLQKAAGDLPVLLDYINRR